MKKSKLILTLALLALGPIGIVFADTENVESTDIVYYDAESLDTVFDKYKDLDINNSGNSTKIGSYNEESNEINNSSNYTIKDETIYKKDENGNLNPLSQSYLTIKEDTYLTDENGKIVKGKIDYKDKSLYFGKDGKLAKDDLLLADGGTYKADSQGKLSLVEKAKAGFIEFKNDKYYFLDDGLLARGLTDTGDARFYFDKRLGFMLRDTIINNENIFVHKDGKANYIGWDYYNGKLGYFDKDEGYAKGLKTIDNITYGFNDEGSIYRKQNRVINGQNYYFDNYGQATKTNGQYLTGWVGDRYYYQDGKPAEGLADIDGKKYAFHERSLRLLRNTQKVFNHKMYKINARGEAIYQYDVAHAYLSRGTGGAFRPGFSSNLARKTPYFTQRDPRWADRAFSGGTFSGYGCGPTVMAMVLNRKLNTNDIYPTNTAAVARDYSSWDGTDWQYFIEGVEAYGLKSYDIPVNKQAFIQALNNNNPIVVRVGEGYFINAGHYMVIDSYKDGYFYINDPYYSQKNTLERHNFKRLRDEVTVAWEIK